jgi:hypothetical protein
MCLNFIHHEKKSEIISVNCLIKQLSTSNFQWKFPVIYFTKQKNNNEKFKDDVWVNHHQHMWDVTPLSKVFILLSDKEQEEEFLLKFIQRWTRCHKTFNSHLRNFKTLTIFNGAALNKKLIFVAVERNYLFTQQWGRLWNLRMRKCRTQQWEKKVIKLCELWQQTGACKNENKK